MAQSNDAAGANTAEIGESSSRDTRAINQVVEAMVDPWEFTQRSQHVEWLKAFLFGCSSPDTTGIASRIASRIADKWDLSDEDKEFVLNSTVADGYTVLHKAVVEEYVGMVKLLGKHRTLKSFEFLHARTYNNGWTALHFAVFCEKLEMVDHLMEWYDDCDDLPSSSPWDFRDHKWMTPLQYAVVAGSIEAVRHLLRRYSVGERGNGASVAVKLVNALDYYRRSAFHMACGHGACVMVEELMANPFVDTNLVDCCAFTPLHWAVYAGAADVVRLFTSKATERTIRTTEEDSEGRPVLQLAIEGTPAIDRKVGKDIQKLLLTVTEVKDEVEGLYRDRQVFVDAANAILVGAALIAGVTFQGWLQPPQGSDLELQIFWAFNSLSFFFSLATVLAGAGAVLPMSDVYIGKAVKSIRRWLAVTSFFLLISVLLVLGAFATAGFSSLRRNSPLYWNMTITTTVGSVVCFITALTFLYRLAKIKVLEDFMMLFSDIFFRMAPFTRRRRHEVGPRLFSNQVYKMHVNVDESLGTGRYSDVPKAVLTKYDSNLVALLALSPSASTIIKDCEYTYNFLSGIRMIGGGGVERRSGEAELTWVRQFVAEMSPEGLHNWGDFPSLVCRERALKKDREELEILKSVLEESREF